MSDVPIPATPTPGVPTVTAEQSVTAMLAAAQLTVSPEEKATMVADFPVIRSAADALYLPELRSSEPAARFDPTTAYSAR